MTPSLSPSLEEIKTKRGKRKQEEEREKESRQTEVALYPKQVRIVQEAHEKIRKHGRGGNASTACPTTRHSRIFLYGLVMDMSPWKGWSDYGRSGRTDGAASPQCERSGGAAGAAASPNPGPIPAPAYGSPVAWQGWSARLPEPAAVDPTSWA